jgi:hypothetical protein
MVGGKEKLSRMYRDFPRNSCNVLLYLGREKDLEMRIRRTYLTVMLAAASAVLASTLAAAPPAAADCISGSGPNPLTLCSQGEARKSNTSPLPQATPYIPYDSCDVNWLCDSGLGIAMAD